MESKQLRYWIALSLALHSLILLVPLTGSVLLPGRAVEVLLVAPEQGSSEVVRVQARRDPDSTASARTDSRRQKVERATGMPVRSDTVQPAVSAEEGAVTAISEASPPASTQSSGVPSASASVRAEDAARSASPRDGSFGAAGGPSFVRQEKPVYPFIAKKLGKEGRVVLRLTIDERGGLSHVEVIEGAGFGFTESAIEAVRKSAFSPAVKDGRPVLSRALLPVRFTLKTN